jgi:hypothetical protein
MNVKFYELAIGARFVFRGQRFQKIAMCMAEDDRRWGNIFRGETDVTLDVRSAECGVQNVGPEMLLPPAEAAPWKPGERLRAGTNHFIPVSLA